EVQDQAQELISKMLNKLEDKGRLEGSAEEITKRITYADDIAEFKSCDLIIEAIVENLQIKKNVFEEIESVVSDTCIIASNTSSLSIASIAAACKNPQRVMGIHFFNPAPLMPLVEIISAVQTDPQLTANMKKTIESWGKVPVSAQDTPGFIVNRIARPFYGEAIRILEEDLANVPTIDWAMKELGGFKMGPFELMDFIGNDINYEVTATVFKEFFFDPRYKPSFTQKRMVEANRLGRKTGIGYYNYGEDATNLDPDRNDGLGEYIVNRIVAMLINEAADALYLHVATKEDIDLAMTKGVNYPKGLLAWADEIGIETCLNNLEELQAEYGEDRYRPCPLLRKMVKKGSTFYE
ncbi:MAG TPA: 3-hydroxybutyryl-CoA dehydrogenase, partial [Flavobacteriales bacterium]|nr:3-hydroxybutyryl-CoA dehydrogenase [Flavobacteriales bacterium]HIO72952.1 3-hydroxybutyryl-CoA dehydrogenase [Flavobacteriales bacterium]